MCYGICGASTFLAKFVDTFLCLIGSIGVGSVCPHYEESSPNNIPNRWSVFRMRLSGSCDIFVFLLRFSDNIGLGQAPSAPP